MAVPKIYHPIRKWAVRNIAISAIVGFGAAQAFWHLIVVPKVERRNLVMKLIEEERIMKKEAVRQAMSEMEFPSSGSYEDLHPSN